jgi:hypothetical protein
MTDTGSRSPAARFEVITNRPQGEAVPGSLRKRGNSWELRAYAGTDPETGKRHWVSATVKGSRRAAQRELVELVSRVDYPRRMTSQATVAKLLTDWFDAVSPN